MAKVTKVKDAFTQSLGDVFGSRLYPKSNRPKEKVRAKRYRKKDKSSLERFAKGSRVRCWWSNNPGHPLNGRTGLVCTERNFGERTKYVVIPKARRQTRTVPDEVAFQVIEMVDEKIKPNGIVWFLTEDEYTIFAVMES